MISSLILSLFLLKKLPLLRKSCGPWTPRLALLGALWQPARSPSPRSTFAGFKPGPARHEHFLAELKASGGAEHNSATCRKPPRIAAALRRDALHHFPLNFAPQPTRTDPQAPRPPLRVRAPGPTHRCRALLCSRRPAGRPAFHSSASQRCSGMSTIGTALCDPPPPRRDGTDRAAAAPAPGRAPPPWSRSAEPGAEREGSFA